MQWSYAFKKYPPPKLAHACQRLTAAVLHFSVLVPLLFLVDPLLRLPPRLLRPGQNEVARQDQEEHGHQHPHSGQERCPPVLLDLNKDVAQVAGDCAEHKLQGPIRVHQLAVVEEVTVTREIGTGKPDL